jgi:hypothetical protein
MKIIRKYPYMGRLLCLVVFFFLSSVSSNPTLSAENGNGDVYLPFVPSNTISTPTADEMWISAARLASLPTTGPAWNNLMNGAQEYANALDISDQDDDTDVYILAKALVYARTGQFQYRSEVIAAITAAMGTETGAGILAVARNMQSLVIAAGLIDLETADPVLNTIFRQWLATMQTTLFDGSGSAFSLRSCHETRPNNIGTHCGASRIAIAIYLKDIAEVQNAADVFKGWLGDRSAYTGFNFGDLDWQCNPSAPVGINPADCTRNGYSIDGVLPDDQRRGGGFIWPPPQENYVWEALQGAVVQAELLNGAGFPTWDWQDKALLRAITWLYQHANYPAVGDDSWQPWLFNEVYGTNFLTQATSSPGKGMGWTDWTHD